MKRTRLVVTLVAFLLFFGDAESEAQITVTSTDTPVSTAQGAGGSPLTSTISFPFSGVITHATVEVAVNAAECGAGALTLTGPGGSVTIMIAINHDAGDVFALVDDNAFNTCGGDCLDGCGMAGAPEPCMPDMGAMADFIGQTSNASPWTLSLGTFVGSGCGPWTLNSWSLTLSGDFTTIFQDGFESGDVSAWSGSLGGPP